VTSSGTPSNELVLVVDDNDEFRRLALRIIVSFGCSVVEASDVASAVRVAREHRPGTVLADIGLPDGDGFGLTEQMLALHSGVRVILMSTDSDIANAAAAQRVGAIAFVPKDQLLSAAVRRLFVPR
jgi:DNA-binding NtrC family response regulator